MTKAISPKVRRMTLATLFASMVLAGVARAQDTTVSKGYAPVIAASNARRDAAAKMLVDWQAKRDGLAKAQAALEKQLNGLAAKPGGADAELTKLNGRVQSAKTRVKELDATLKALKPDAFKMLAEMTAYDRLVDERDGLLKALPMLQGDALARVRTIVRRDATGAKLADEWEERNVEFIAAASEAKVAQARRDTVSRSEGNLQNSTKPHPEPPAELLRVTPPAPADAAARARRFAERTTADGVRALGERFFSQMTLTHPGLEKVKVLVERGDHAAALDAYKRFFFENLMKSDEGAPDEAADEDSEPEGSYNRASSVFPPPAPEHVAQALAGVVSETVSIKGKARRIETNLGPAGAMNWAFLAPKTAEEDANGPHLLDFCQRQGYPGYTFSELLHSYALGGPKAHLQRWAETLDDWAMNWQADVERSPLPLRNYHLIYVSRIQETRMKLKVLAEMRPSFVDDLPAATFARWLMAMNEEYLGAAIRLGRSGLYNFRIMALNSMVPTSLKMQEFHAHQWALREGWRQMDDNFLFKIRRDGANFEFANDGHEDTDQGMLYTFNTVRSWNPNPVWTEPFWSEEFLDNFLGNTRYWVHNMKQDGWCYRLSVRDQRFRYIGAHPRYKVNMLTDEDEVRRRVWKVHGAGKPEENPKVNSEGMAFQGYYYLRSGWEPEDYFLYFQSIGQPILSGREDNTGFSLYGKGGIFMLSPAPAVDGRTQNAHFGLVLDPGGKAHYANYGLPDAVRPHRFHSDEHFDLAEGAFDGVYQYHRPSVEYDVFGSYGYEGSLNKAKAKALKAGQEFTDDPIRDVRQSRRILSVRGRELYIVTDLFESKTPHAFTQNYQIYTPVRMDNSKTRLALLQSEKAELFTTDPATRVVNTHNMGMPNIELRHIGALPLQYVVHPDKRLADATKPDSDLKAIVKGMNKRDKQHGDASKAIEFSRQLDVNWQGSGEQLLVTLVSPRGHEYEAGESTLRDVKPIATRQDMAGFTAKFADGTAIAYLASAKPATLALGGIEATASTLLVVGGHGVALDCTAIRAGGASLKPATADLTFRIESGKVVADAPIYRPIKPVVISPGENVFTDTMKVTLACETDGVDLRYTLDGSRPTPKSALYTAPFTVNATCRLKARAFRKGVTEDVWQQDGTHATVIYSAVFRKESPAPAIAPRQTFPGLKYEYYEGVWTELLVRSMTIPAKSTGTVSKLMDVSARKTDGAFGLRYEGYLDAPADGVYTFHAPREYCFPDVDCGYDLRVFVDGREWNPAVRWQGHGTWSIALGKGRHAFKVVFTDLRLRPHKVELMWGYPHPDFTWKGVAPTLQISGPDHPKAPIPDAWLSHDS